MTTCAGIGSTRSGVDVAAWVYITRASFNGLVRVNSRGHFNVPCGYTLGREPKAIRDAPFLGLRRLMATGALFADGVTVLSDWRPALAQAHEVVHEVAPVASAAAAARNSVRCLAICDPPYLAKGEFTGYSNNDFSTARAHRALAEALRGLPGHVHWLLHGADSEASAAAYDPVLCPEGAHVFQVTKVRRRIGAAQGGAGRVSERLWASANWPLPA